MNACANSWPRASGSACVATLVPSTITAALASSGDQALLDLCPGQQAVVAIGQTVTIGESGSGSLR